MSVGTYALISRDDVLAYRMAQGEVLKTTPEMDTFFDSLIDQMSTKFETYCDRQFVSRAHTDYLDGESGTVLFPKHYPITSVSGIWDDSAWSWAADDEITSTGVTVPPVEVALTPLHNEVVVT